MPVTLSAPSELAEGTFQIRLTGTSEASNNLRLAAGDFSQPLSLVITPFNPFTISMQPAIFAMPVDSVTSAFLSVKKRAGFTEAVRISFVNLPSGVSFLCHAQECPAQAQDSYTVEFEDQILFSLSYAADAPIANHSASIEVSKLDGSAKKTIPLQLNVQAAAINPTFKLLAASLSVTAPFDTDVAVRLSIVRTKGFDKQIVLKSITEGFRANDVVTGQNSTLSFINVRRLKDSSLFLPANQIFTIQGQAVGANITKNLNMTFNIIPVSGDRDLTLSSSVITSSGAADHGLVVLPDGRYVVGSTETSSFVLRRFNADGSPDPGFVSRFQTAKVIISFGDPAELRAIALAPDGDLVAVGIVRVGSSQARNVAVVKVNPDGSLDESFGGKRVIPFSLGEARAVVVTSSGQILIAGQTASTLPESSVFLPQAEVATSCLIFALRGKFGIRVKSSHFILTHHQIASVT